MKITVLETINVEGIPSGSGLVKSGDIYYIVGDDSPYLFSLNKEFKIIDKIQLLDGFDFIQKRIAKSKKPDFEALEMIGDAELVVFGSGSKSPQRNVFIRILLQAPIIIEKYDLSDFYNNLKNLNLFKDSELNIEAAAYRNDKIFLFNRNKNFVISFEYMHFILFLKAEMPFPKVEIKQFNLPKINGIEAGFSGATSLTCEPKIIFTASVENTANAYDDGEILGSFIGLIDISNNLIADSFDYCQIPNTVEQLKVESVTVEEEITYGNTKVALITDDDKGNTLILESLLSW